jgi:hypothetical protein
MTRLLLCVSIALLLTAGTAWAGPIQDAAPAQGRVGNIVPSDADDPLSAPNRSHRIYQQSDYDPSSVTKKTYVHGEVQITLIQVKDTKDSTVDGLGGYCRAWLQIQKGEEVVDEKYYDDIYPVGGKYGLFVPRNQPSQNYFIVLVLGGYSGQLLLINRKGQIVDLRGGPLFVTSDRRFIFSTYSSDLSGLSVFDLGKV